MNMKCYQKALSGIKDDLQMVIYGVLVMFMWLEMSLNEFILNAELFFVPIFLQSAIHLENGTGLSLSNGWYYPCVLDKKRLMTYACLI